MAQIVFCRCTSKWNIFLIYFISWIGIIIFAKGFFPMKALPQKNASSTVPLSPHNNMVLSSLLKKNFSHDENVKVVENGGEISTSFHKLVFVLIDAMRFDFVSDPRYSQHMPFTQSLMIKGRGKLYKSLAKAPTVTLPRIKALLTGSVPGYLDVLLNLDQSAELKEDSLISSLTAAKKKIIFYGDTTWIRLFPTSFLRKEGTLGLYVTDYTEVDRNVTRHLNSELNDNKDWDVMILHYLGLDHVGHLVGPNSPIMASKLSEMDSVIKSIFTSLQQEKNAFVVVTSDHGMTSQGSHGGTTTPEVETPLLFLYPDPSITSWSGVETIYQTDIAPTLSLLMGVTIPTTSMGRIIPASLQFFDREAELHGFQYNCHHLLRHASHADIMSEFSTQRHPLDIYRNALQLHSTFLSGEGSIFSHAKEAYMECQELLSDKLTSKLASYDYPMMALGALLLALGLCSLFIVWMKIILLSRHDTMGCDDSSRRMTRALLSLSLGSLLHVTTLPGSSFVEEEHQIWHFLTASVCLFLFIVFLRTIARANGSTSNRPTSCLYQAQLNPPPSVLRLRRDQNLTWQLDGARVDDLVVGVAADVSDDAAPSIDGKHVHLVWFAFLGVVVHRVNRAWNQTGIKYADQPDIEDYLNSIENKTLLSFISLSGLAVIGVLLEVRTPSRDLIRTCLSCMGFIGVYLYRVAICAVDLPWLTGSCGKGIRESWFVYACVGSLLLKSAYHRLVSCLSREKRSSYSSELTSKSVDCFVASLVLISSLLLRPHNHMVLAFNIFLFLIIFRLLWPVVVENQRHIINSRKLFLLVHQPGAVLASSQLVARIILAYWFGQMAYFTLGNSNSFATVDLSAAYIGLSGGEGSFNFVAAGALGAFATYSGPILWTTMCVADIVTSCPPESKYRTGRSNPAACLASTLACFRLLSLLVYVTVATGHRFHLFVWSVFSPKLMYELVNTSVHGWMIMFVLLLC